MSNVECLMNDEARMTKRTASRLRLDIRHSSFVISSRGARAESNRHPLVHSQPCRNRYTTDTKIKCEVQSTKYEMRWNVKASDFVLCTSHFVLAFAPTRTRTWNTQLEAAHDVLFTIGAHHPFAFQAEGKGVEPSSRRARTALAERPGQPYQATFRICHSVDSPRIELGFPDCQPGVVPLDHEP